MLHGLGMLTRRCLPPEKYDEAELLYRRALDIAEHKLGDNHSFTATVLNNLAEVLQAQGAPLYAIGRVSATLGMWSHAVLPSQLTMHKQALVSWHAVRSWHAD
jgi:hypothetical protein